MNILYANDVEGLMEARGIKEEDLQALFAAEPEAPKTLRSSEGAYLSRKRIGTFCLYAEYTKDDQSVTVQNVYSHVVTFSNDGEM